MRFGKLLCEGERTSGYSQIFGTHKKIVSIATIVSLRPKCYLKHYD